MQRNSEAAVRARWADLVSKPPSSEKRHERERAERDDTPPRRFVNEVPWGVKTVFYLECCDDR